MRLRGKVDKNQAEMVNALRKAGASVVSLANLGSGVPDLLVGFRKQNFLIEGKVPGGKLTPDQVKFHEQWRGRKIAVSFCSMDALLAIGAITIREYKKGKQ